MNSWNQVRWTQARQVAAAMGLKDPGLPAEAVEPGTYCEQLRTAGRDEDAVAFLGHALSRFDTVAWAGHVLAEEAQEHSLPPADRQALDHALRWLGDPSDAHRRTAHAAGRAADEGTPEQLLAMAVFFSGGSISAPDLPPVQPAPELAGRFASGAVRLAAHRSSRPEQVLARALEVGERVATLGPAALTAA